MTIQRPSGPADDAAQNPVSPDGHYRWDGQNWQPILDSYGPPATAIATRGGVATVWVLLSILFCFPVGFVLVFLSRWTQKTKFAVAGSMAAILLLFMAIGANSPQTPGTANLQATTSAGSQSGGSTSDTAAAAKAAADKAAADKAAADQAAAAKAAADNAAADKAAADKAAADKAAADKAAADQAAAAGAAAVAAAPPPQTSADPYPAATAAGATAVCADSTYSYSATRSGTCSHHGGVHWWTGNVGPAGPGAH